MSSPFTKYQGYRPVANIEAKMPYPPNNGGGRTFVENKFHAPQRHEVPPDADSLNSSVFVLGNTTVRPGDYHVPERKVGLQILPMEKPMWIKPVSHAEYPSFPGVAQTLAQISDEALEKGFLALDVRNEGFILANEIRAALREAFGGEEPDQFAVALLEGVAAKHSLTRLSVDTFVQVVRIAAQQLQSQLDSQTPASMKEANTLRMGTAGRRVQVAAQGGEEKKGEEEYSSADLASTAAFEAGSSSRSGGDTTRRLLTAGPVGGVDLSLRGLHLGHVRKATLSAAAEAVGRPHASADTGDRFHQVGPDMQTAYGRDMGEYGSNPRDRPSTDPSGKAAGFMQTTRDMSAGTNRTSRHPPGYTGHVPQEQSGKAYEQGQGAAARNTFHQKNNLDQTHSHHVFGYGGHQPSHMLTGSSTIVKARGAAAASDYDHNMGHIESYWASYHAAKAGKL